jgi:hypothetical protein
VGTSPPDPGAAAEASSEANVIISNPQGSIIFWFKWRMFKTPHLVIRPDIPDD